MSGLARSSSSSQHHPSSSARVTSLTSSPSTSVVRSDATTASSTHHSVVTTPTELSSHSGSGTPQSVKSTRAGPVDGETGTSDSTTSNISTSSYSISRTADTQPTTTKSQSMSNSGSLSPTFLRSTEPPVRDNTPAAPAPSPEPTSSSSESMSTTKPSSTSHSTSHTSTRTSATPAPAPAPPKPSETSTHVDSTAVKADDTNTNTIPTPVTTSVTVVTGSPSRTATVTITPTVTLSAALALNVTVDGSNFMTTPAVVTILSTSTDPNGNLVTVTEVASNPTGSPTPSSSVKESSGSVLQHKGAVAGIFVVVGLAVVAIIVGLVLFIRRQRKASKRNRWLEGMQPQPAPSFSDNDPFMDPQNPTPPTMRSVDDNHLYTTQWAQRISPISPITDLPMQHPHDRRDFGYGGAMPMANVGHSDSSEDFQHHSTAVPVGFAYSTDIGQNRDLLHPQQFEYSNVNANKRHSYAPSSPSIYPASLPNEDEEAIRPVVGQLEGSKSQEPPAIGAVPPRPPRSRLRQSARSSELMGVVTPPTSMISSGHSAAYTGVRPPSPVGENSPQDIFARRTLLDVRSRPLPPPK